MKLQKFLPIALFTLASGSALAEDLHQEADTVMMIRNARSVVLTESANGAELTVRGTADDPDFLSTFNIVNPQNAVVTTKQRFNPPVITVANIDPDCRRDAIDLFGGLHAGFCTPLGAPAGLDVEMGKSYEIGIDRLISYRITDHRSKSSLSIGMGVNWRNYRMTGNTRFIADESGNVSFGPFPEGTESRYSRIKVFSLSFPLTWYQPTRIRTVGKSFLTFRAGAILNWNSHASVVSCWNESNGESAKHGTKNVAQRKFTVDIYGAVGIIYGVGFYVKYSPMSLFEKGKGPDVTTFSTGVTFAL